LYNACSTSEVFSVEKEEKVPPFLDFDLLEGVEPRVFPIYPHPFPCYEPEPDWYLTTVQRSPADTGLLFMKEMKTGSSTMAGVNLRMAKNRGPQHGYKICRARFDHSMAFQLKYGHRIRTQSFLWTVIRDPTQRAVSQFFHFRVSREKAEPTDANFQAYLQNPVFTNYYLKSLHMQPYRHGRDDVVEVVNAILQEYDFIGITERLDESLVVLSMLLNVKLTDVLYLNAKNHGGFDDGRFNETCVYIVPSYVSPTMKTWLAEDAEWKERTRGDQLLYQAAWRSLDRTIDKLGREEVQRQVLIFQEWRHVAEAECASQVMFPCKADGTRVISKTRSQAPGCLWNDSGCGNDCLDRVVKKVLESRGEEEDS
jgi:hypothetical protein